MLGHWKDYEELEESLSMPELTATLKAMYDLESRKNKFMASLQGVDLDEGSKTEDSDDKPSTLQEVQARAAARLNADASTVGAIKQGISPDMGISYDIIVRSDS